MGTVAGAFFAAQGHQHKEGARGLRWNEHIEGDGEAIFRRACKLGLEGIIF
jgi:ATP-dependent DNA ligase